jgi:superoxide dismutase, Fe-Mn family
MTRRSWILSGASAALLPRPMMAAAATLPKLPYAFDALEPHIDARTMEIHYAKHHQAYVDNLNKALAGYPQVALHPVDHLIGDLNMVPEPIRMAVRNNGGGHMNHSLFWQVLGKPKGGPKGKLAAAITKSFGSQAAFEEKLRTAGLGQFGSGWVWVTAKDMTTLQIETTPNQDSPWMKGTPPIMGIDVWEHAYYLKYQNRRADYLTAVLQVINWEFVSARYEDLV